MRKVKPVSVSVSAVLILCGGCGGGVHNQRASTSTGAATKGARRPVVTPLTTAVYSRCDTSKFAPPAVSPISRTSPPVGWQVTYLYPTRAPRPPRPGQTTNVTIVERAPVGPPPQLAGGKEITVAGRRVSLRNRTKTTIYVAAWKTATARYTALADGATPVTLERFIACLP